jgi:integrase
MFFDPRAAKALQPGKHLVVVGCPGLRLVATDRFKTWTYRYRPSGSAALKQVSLGHWPAVPVAEAVGLWQSLRDARAGGADPRGVLEAPRHGPVAVEAGPGAGPTVDRIVRRYIKSLASTRKAAGAQAAERALLAMLEEHPSVASTPAAKLTRAQAYAVIDSKRSTPTAAAKLRSLLGAAWDDAYDPGVLPQDAPNWWRQVLRGKLKSKGKIVGGEHVGPKRRVLRLDEAAVLLRWSADNMHALGADVLTLYLWTGARGAEILSMRPEHVAEEPTGWWWTVPAALTKNAGHDFATDLRVPLLGRALAVVQRRIQEAGEGELFESTRGLPYTQHDFSTYVYDLQPYSVKSRERPTRAVLPVTHWTPHHLRRTVRTNLSALGCPKDVAEAILGHMPETIEATYNLHSYDAERREWLCRWADKLEEISG